MRIKVCGITSLEDAEAAQRLGAWAIGLNHHPESPRFVAPDVAAEIGAALKRRCEVAGVFVNASLGEIERAAEAEQLTLLQLHGDEGPAFCAEAARRTGCKVIKALRIRSSADVRAAKAFRTDYHLLDAYHPGRPGGTGESFDWELTARHGAVIPMILAGGLRPENVSDAIAATHPFAVDVASGVEAEPGRKDHERLEAFFESANAATPTGSAR
ncbi:MAG TPA: phosphoribosylanthranilate isomerase [Solirubrobacterales bacterium]|nr:phosphoribosylanthranilate isomerase [Solirubrobacterales bacterium]